jgi:hypothetical protein
VTGLNIGAAVGLIGDNGHCDDGGPQSLPAGRLMNPYEAYSHGDAEGYAAARPEYPDGLFDRLRERCHGRDFAWDCATGSGQAASRLSSRT